MSQTIQALIEQVNTAGDTVSFQDVMDVISRCYSYQQTTFSNGDVVNQAGTNEGSCKIFAFAQLNNLSEQATLNCFGQYYRDDVLKNPTGDDHGNIRNFMEHGWAGIKFEQKALTAI